jgi:hypothetical protein
MRKLFFFLILSILSLPVTLSAQCSSALPLTGIYAGVDGPAQYVVSMPSPASCYNGRMIFFAHGYVVPGSPQDAWLSQVVLPDGTSLPAFVNQLGFGFAASSFSKDGLAIPEGVKDTLALTTVLQGLGIAAQKVFVTGVSEGGLVAVKALETDPIYSGGIAVCAPIGSFQQEVNYLGDVRVLFDYFFPGVLTTGTPGESAMSIPPALQLNWFSVYRPNVLKALAANPLATLQLLFAANIPVGLNFSNAGDAIAGVLQYNVFATNDARVTLKGSAYDNLTRVYRGSFNDARLNALVARFSADPVDLRPYETTGLLRDPLVTLHTLADPITPFGQEALYASKAKANQSLSELIEIPAFAYGHCNVTASETATALYLMLVKEGF